MKEIQKMFNGKHIRVEVKNGELLFIAKDIAESLGYTWNGSSRIEHVPEEWRGITSVVTPYGTQEMAYLTEQGLYFFLGRSDKKEALPFQKWIAGEVIPSIRKTGKYEIPRDIKERSTEGRNLLTGQWQRQGVSKRVEYGSLTKETYRQIFNNPDLRKAAMDLGQVLKLTAFESVEAWKLSENPENALGYSGCRESITETAGLLEAVRNQNLLRSAQV
jgi:prophage antirepressor-like protein